MKECSNSKGMKPEEERKALCESLVKSGVKTIRDGNDHSDKASRCMVEGGICVGFYAILIDYDPVTDTFGIGWKQRIPSKQVDEVAVFDALNNSRLGLESALNDFVAASNK
jgi:hypothetical protein